jgi:predicted lipoprotein
MNDQEKTRRAVAAQGLAAIAFFFFAHGAHAATVPAHGHVSPAQAAHAPAFVQSRRP